MAHRTPYIHFNPVKHGYVSRAIDWPTSTFRSHAEKGWYDPAWGVVEPEEIRDLGNTGE